jgi:hypothetical protein
MHQSSQARFKLHMHLLFLGATIWFLIRLILFLFSFRYGDDAQKILVEPPAPAVAATVDQKSESSISSEELLTRLK